METKHKWIKIGTHLFDIDEMKGAWIQKNHLIIEVDFKHDHIVYHFKNLSDCEKVFKQLCEAKEAVIIETDANYNPDIMKTFYGDQFDRQIKMIKMYEVETLKVRYQKKVDKLIQEVKEMKEIIEKQKKK